VEGKIALAFFAGLVSFATPCVLPLVPGYLSTVSGTAPGVAGRRVVVASLPFIAGFTAVFVLLGAAAALAGGFIEDYRRFVPQVAGILIVALGFGFMGILPLPWLDRMVAPELVEGARRRGSSALLGAAFGVCAAPCTGPVLAGILALAGDTGTVLEGSALLLVYSLGLAVPFVLVGIGFAHAMGAFRWLRDHFEAIRIASGAILVAAGLLLFFDRWWWLSATVNRAMETIGLG
jgi:cytochrome c-type biogenesis protein